MKLGISYILFDCSIEDLEVRKAQAKVFPSALKLAAFIGLSANKIPLYTDPKKQKRYYSESQGREYAIRIAREP